MCQSVPLVTVGKKLPNLIHWIIAKWIQCKKNPPISTSVRWRLGRSKIGYILLIRVYHLKASDYFVKFYSGSLIWTINFPIFAPYRFHPLTTRKEIIGTCAKKIIRLNQTNSQIPAIRSNFAIYLNQNRNGYRCFVPFEKLVRWKLNICVNQCETASARPTDTRESINAVHESDDSQYSPFCWKCSCSKMNTFSPQSLPTLRGYLIHKYAAAFAKIDASSLNCVQYISQSQRNKSLP